MIDSTNLLETLVAAIGAIGGLGTAAFGLVDASKAVFGGVSRFGFKHVMTALRPFESALNDGEADWRLTIQANWINGVPKDDQKAAAKSLIRLGLSADNAEALAKPGRVDPAALKALIQKIDQGATLGPQDVNLLGRFNAAIDAALDGGFERGDQQYRNASRLAAGLVAVTLAVTGGGLLAAQTAAAAHPFNFVAYLVSAQCGLAVLVGFIATPLAPIAKDLASSLQAAVGAVGSVRP
ncbi:MAG TPA: hypothetical protein VGI79_04350 [Caulobacteraceae bacterium]|jgi:hypothetical protein